MFARSAILRQTIADVHAKTAANTRGACGSTVSTLGCFGAVIGVTLVGFGLNLTHASTRRVTDSYVYGESAAAAKH